MNSDFTSRWKAGNGLSAHTSILRAMQARQFNGQLSPFEKAGALYDLRGFSVKSLREIAGCEFIDVDLTSADFTSVHIEKCTFTNVRFDRSSLSGFSDFGNRFERCSFVQSAFNGATVGGQGTRFSDCAFDRCDFLGTSFVRPEFDRCDFISCNLKGVDFSGASFVESRFIGKLQNVWFRGGFAYPSQTKNFGIPRRNAMFRVSFAQADLRWVTFSNDCDLSTVTLPTDGKHALYDHWGARLQDAKSIIQQWDESERSLALNYLRTFQSHAEGQGEYILNVQEVFGELGEHIGAKVVQALGAPVAPV